MRMDPHVGPNWQTRAHAKVIQVYVYMNKENYPFTNKLFQIQEITHAHITFIAFKNRDALFINIYKNNLKTYIVTTQAL